MRKKLDLTNQRFGRLVAIRPAEERWHGKIQWECICDCGNKKLVVASLLKCGGVNTCGCLRDDLVRKTVPKARAAAMKVNCVEKTDLRRIREGTQKNNTSGRRGVSWSHSRQKWYAQIKFQRKKIFLGYYNDFDKAVQAREEAEEKYFTPVLIKYAVNAAQMDEI